MKKQVKYWDKEDKKFKYRSENPNKKRRKKLYKLGDFALVRK